jgi:protoporphyrinogen oxidase
MKKQTAIIIGGGPAGLTAAYEFLDKTDIQPIIFEATDAVGGISRTINYKGNRMDIGGHRFFSKSDVVMNWWLNILPLQGAPAKDDRLLGRAVTLSTKSAQREIGADAPRITPAPDPESVDTVMLERNRLSRILFLRKFFDYPVSLSRNTIANLGLLRMMKIACSYMKARCCPIKPVISLEDFFINQFGFELYRTFFRDYTEKVWGVKCRDIPSEWGIQRIKGLSLWKAILHAIKSMTSSKTVLEQKKVETSLIEAFLYPKFGPGQLWETVADRIREHGAEIHLQSRVVGLHTDGARITGIEVENSVSGERTTVSGDYILSTMPIRNLIQSLDNAVPADVQRVADGLCYRDFMTVGVLAKKLRLTNNTDPKTVNNIVPDNWIYIQEPDVSVGRLQIFNNWSPYMVADQDTIWVGMEYFCTENDAMWAQPDQQFSTFAVSELVKIGVLQQEDVLDTVVVRVQKAYPAYFGTYNEFATVRDYTDTFENLFLIGRNGMHRYNNMDHSMLAAITAVDNIRRGITSKHNLWAVNAEEEYHETK